MKVLFINRRLFLPIKICPCCHYMRSKLIPKYSGGPKLGLSVAHSFGGAWPNAINIEKYQFIFSKSDHKRESLTCCDFGKDHLKPPRFKKDRQLSIGQHTYLHNEINIPCTMHSAHCAQKYINDTVLFEFGCLIKH